MKKRKFTAKECTAVYSLGASVYTILEVIWRGFTHWTMFFVGGICFLLIYIKEKTSDGKGLALRALRGSLIITGVEFLSGCIINKLFHLQVWDYSSLRINLFGQICLVYTFLWFLLSFPICFICREVRKLF